MVQAAIAWLLLGIVSAAAGSPGRYDAYDREAYLSYLNAPGPHDDIAAVPRLRISFGGRSYDAVMDTGSTGVVVSADKIPNIDRLPSLGPGELTYSSSGRIMIGRWVVTAMTIAGGNGTRVTTAPIPVLAVTRIECTPRARRCTPREAPRRTSMLGIGFGRPALPQRLRLSLRCRGRLRGPALDRPAPTVVWQSRLAVKLMARRPPHSWVSTDSPRS